jgi:UDP-N-acetylglucosamine 4-epimerase
VGCGERITINALWQRIRELTGSTAEARYDRGRQGDVRDSLASLDDIRRYLGYEPAVDLEEGLRRTIEYLSPARIPA